MLLLPPPRSCPVTVRVRRKSLAYLPSIREKLSAIFGVQLQEVLHSADEQQYQHQQQQQQQFVTFQVLDEASGCQVAIGSVLSGSLISSGNGDLIGQIQVSVFGCCLGCNLSRLEPGERGGRGEIGNARETRFRHIVLRS